MPRRRSSVPIPFPVGRWKGTDGSEVIANLNPGDYVTKITSDISVDPKWSNDLTSVGGGAQVGFRLFGTGDIGGGPDPASIAWLEKSIANKNGAVEIRNTSADQLSRDLTPAQPTRYRQQRAVAAEDENQLGLDSREVLLPIGFDADEARPRMVRQPVPKLVQRLRHQWLARVGDDEQAGHVIADFRSRSADCEEIPFAAPV